MVLPANAVAVRFRGKRAGAAKTGAFGPGRRLVGPAAGGGAFPGRQPVPMRLALCWPGWTPHGRRGPLSSWTSFDQGSSPEEALSLPDWGPPSHPPPPQWVTVPPPPTTTQKQRTTGQAWVFKPELASFPLFSLASRKKSPDFPLGGGRWAGIRIMILKRERCLRLPVISPPPSLPPPLAPEHRAFSSSLRPSSWQNI